MQDLRDIIKRPVITENSADLMAEKKYTFEVDKKDHSPKELLDFLRFHLDLFDQYNEDGQRHFRPLRRYFKIYVREFKGANDLRIQLMETNTTDEARQLIDHFENKFLTSDVI